MQEIDEGALEPIEVTFVGAHVVGVDIGDHGNHGLQVQKAGVALVGLGDQVAAGAELGIGTGGIEAATDDEGRVQAFGCEHRSDQTGGGGLAMGTGHGDAMTIAHQLGEHLGAGHHGNALLEGGGDFRIGSVDGTGHHQHVDLIQVLGAVADVDARAELLQARGHRGFLEVRTRDFVAQVQQHLAMPHMPTPPIPTKWMRRMLRMRRTSAWMALCDLTTGNLQTGVDDCPGGIGVWPGHGCERPCRQDVRDASGPR